MESSKRFEFQITDSITLIIHEPTVDLAIKKALELLHVYDSKEGISARDREVSLHSGVISRTDI